MGFIARCDKSQSEVRLTASEVFAFANVKYFASQKMKCSACGETKRKTLRVLIYIRSVPVFELVL